MVSITLISLLFCCIIKSLYSEKQSVVIISELKERRPLSNKAFAFLRIHGIEKDKPTYEL